MNPRTDFENEDENVDEDEVMQTYADDEEDADDEESDPELENVAHVNRPTVSTAKQPEALRKYHKRVPELSR